MLGLPLLLLAAAQDDATQAKDILARAAKPLKDAPAIRVDVEFEVKGQAARQRWSILLRRPNLARLEQSFGDKVFSQTILDGKIAWTYVAGTKQYSKTPQEAISALYLLFPLTHVYFQGEPEKLLASVTGVRVKREKLGETPCEIIEWTAGASEGRLWVDDKNVMRRYDQKTTFQGKAYPEQTQHFLRLDLDPKVADDAFVFAPPADAKPLKELDEGGQGQKPRTSVARGKGTPEEIRLAQEKLEGAAKRLGAAKTIRYRIEWTQKSADSTVKAVGRRPNQALYEMVNADGDVSFGLLDGKDYWGFDKKGEGYITVPQGAVPAKFYFDPVLSLYFAGTAKDLLALAGDLRFRKETLDEASFAVVTWRVRFTAGLLYAVWIDDQQRIRMVERIEEDVVLDRLQYAEYEDDVKLADEVFNYRPPAGAKCLYSAAEEERGLLAVGAPAPDFEASDPSGKAVRLSHFKGRVVLLHVWEFP